MWLSGIHAEDKTINIRLRQGNYSDIMVMTPTSVPSSLDYKDKTEAFMIEERMIHPAPGVRGAVCSLTGCG